MDTLRLKWSLSLQQRVNYASKTPDVRLQIICLSIQYFTFRYKKKVYLIKNELIKEKNFLELEFFFFFFLTDKQRGEGGIYGEI